MLPYLRGKCGRQRSCQAGSHCLVLCSGGPGFSTNQVMLKRGGEAMLAAEENSDYLVALCKTSRLVSSKLLSPYHSYPPILQFQQRVTQTEISCVSHQKAHAREETLLEFIIHKNLKKKCALHINENTSHTRRRYLLNTYVEERTCMQKQKTNNSLSKVTKWVRSFAVLRTYMVEGDFWKLSLDLHMSVTAYTYHTHSQTQIHAYKIKKKRFLVKKKNGGVMVAKACKVREDTIQEAKAG